MQIELIAIGKKMPDWLQTGLNHYQKQLPKSLNFKLITLDAQHRKSNNVAKVKQLEGALLLHASKSASLIIALDEHGKQQSTESITTQMARWQQDGERVALLIGGADGLSEACKQRAQLHWGLSHLTLPHAMARLLALEQIYRAHSRLNNHPYHRA